MARIEKINEILRNIRINSPDIIGAVVISIEGLPIASVAPDELDEELISGMAAALIGAGEQMSEELMGAKMEQTFVKTEKGYVVLNFINDDSVLALLASKRAKLGLIFLELKRAVRELATEL